MFQIYIVGILRASLHYGKNYGSSRLWFQWNIFHKVYNVCVCKSFPQCDAQCIQLEDFSPVWGIISHKFSSICCSNVTTIWLNHLGPLMSCNWQCCSSVFCLKRGALVSDAQKLSKQNHNREGRVHHRLSYILQCKDITPSSVFCLNQLLIWWEVLKQEYQHTDIQWGSVSPTIHMQARKIFSFLKHLLQISEGGFSRNLNDLLYFRCERKGGAVETHLGRL